MLDWELVASYPTYSGKSMYADMRVYTTTYKGIEAIKIEVEDYNSSAQVFAFDGSVDVCGHEIRFSTECQLVNAIDTRVAIRQGGECQEHAWEQAPLSALRCKLCGIFFAPSLYED